MPGTWQVLNILLITRSNTFVGIPCQPQKHMKEIQDNENMPHEKD